MKIAPSKVRCTRHRDALRARDARGLHILCGVAVHVCGVPGSVLVFSVVMADASMVERVVSMDVADAAAARYVRAPALARYDMMYIVVTNI